MRWQSTGEVREPLPGEHFLSSPQTDKDVIRRVFVCRSNDSLYGPRVIILEHATSESSLGPGRPFRSAYTRAMGTGPEKEN